MYKKLVIEQMELYEQLLHLRNQYEGKTQGHIYFSRVKYLGKKLAEVNRKLENFGKYKLITYTLVLEFEHSPKAKYTITLLDELEVTDLILMVQIRTGALKVEIEKQEETIIGQFQEIH